MTRLVTRRAGYWTEEVPSGGMAIGRLREGHGKPFSLAASHTWTARRYLTGSQ